MSYVTDTHSLIWYLTSNPKLSEKARNVFEKVDSAREYIFIPCIVFFELLYLIEKKKIVADFDGFLALIHQSKNYRIEPLCLPIIEKSREISRDSIPDPWDRLIAATSLHLSLPLITQDESLSKIGLRVIW